MFVSKSEKRKLLEIIMSYFGVEEIEHLSARGAEDLDDTDPIRVLVHKLATSGKDGERTRSIIPAGIGSRVMFVPDGVGKRGPDAVELWGYLHGLLSQDCRALILAEDMCEDMRLTMDALSDWRNILPMVKHVYFNMYLREP